MKTVAYVLTALLSGVLLSSCGINRSLHPVNTGNPVDVKELAGNWHGLGVDNKTVVTARAELDAAQPQQLKVKLEIKSVEDVNKVDKVVPLLATVYELNGIRFMNLSADRAELDKMIGEAGYTANAISKNIFHPWVYLFNVEFTKDTIELSAVSFSEIRKDGQKGKLLSDVALFDDSEVALLNPSSEITAILRAKKYVATKLLTLTRSKN